MDAQGPDGIHLSHTSRDHEWAKPIDERSDITSRAIPIGTARRIPAAISVWARLHRAHVPGRPVFRDKSPADHPPGGICPMVHLIVMKRYAPASQRSSDAP